MSNWHGTRSGWNTRGGTAKEHFDSQLRMIKHNNKNPTETFDLQEFEAECTTKETLRILLNKLGREKYEAWIDQAISENASWSEIKSIAYQKLQEIKVVKNKSNQ